MQIKSLVVQIDNSRANNARLSFALHIAKRTGAYLTGCYTVQSLNPVVYSSGTALSGVYSDAMEECTRNTIAAETEFENRVSSEDVPCDWVAREGSVAGNLIQVSRYADLTIAGQYDPDDPHSVEPRIAESLAMESGRPVLVTPYIGAPESAGSRVLIAWDASRESARAVHDAMPFLETAEHVDVLHMHHNELPPDQGSPAGRLSEVLGRNGVNAHAEDFNIGTGEVGDALLSRAADLGSNLIVMGAYGHSRFREMVLGGATHDLLSHMTVPVLMSH